jgi:hypothetical protein
MNVRWRLRNLPGLIPRGLPRGSSLNQIGSTFIMKRAWLTLLCSLIILNACSTIEYFHKKDSTSLWSSSDPLSIPYSVRAAQFEKGNLVTNPSFEAGSVLSSESKNTFSLRGWETVGQNVKWVNPESDRHAAEKTSHGRHAVKITREHADELDATQGIRSQYIPVIPGNYYFTYDVKLKDIASNKSRLGVKLYDAVVIKVLFFDKDKQPVDPGYMNPTRRKLVDNSDKSYSFSNYWAIDDFPWGTVRARSYNYPFSEGDIPDRTRYVRLFFGLKGTGSLWLDNIVFQYSKWNFTTLERFKPYFGRQLTLEERIIPTPKSIQKVNTVAYYDPKLPESHLAVIVLPENPASAERTAARILQDKISEVLGKVMPGKKRKEIAVRIVEKGFSLDDLFKAKLVLSIGRNKVYQKIQPDLPLQLIRDKKQGYVIKAEPIGNTHIVFLIGDTPSANFNAAATAVQLFENDKAIYHNAIVVDYPDFLGRSYAFKIWKNAGELKTDLENMERMSLYKLNKVYVGYIRADNVLFKKNRLYLKGIKEAGRISRTSGVMSLAVMVNPYSHFTFEASVEKLSPEARYTWTHSSPQSFDNLKDFLKIGLDAGADTVMLLADDFVPHTGKNRKNYSLYTHEDKKRFVNLQNAQAHIINRLKQWIDKEYPGTRFEFCPPWYSNEHIDRSQGKAEVYFKELTYQIPDDVAIIWTGPTIRSLSVDMADLNRYKSLIGRWPMFWDNTLYARNLETKRYGGYTTYYPGKVRMCNLFEPYDTYRPKDFQKYNDDRQVYINADAYSEVYKIKYATVADYLWNAAAYDPELALWKVLSRTYGPALGEALLRFNDAYYGLYDIFLRMEFEGVNDTYVKKGRILFKDLENCLRNISQALAGDQLLLKELENYRDRQKKRFAKLSKDQFSK